jgi:hypothetical protein
VGSYAEDIKFVLQEAARFAKLELSELENLSFEDAMSMLPHPSGQGDMICGIKAQERLYDLVEIAISRSKFVSRIKIDPLIRELKTVIIQRFVTEHRELSIREADRAVSAAIRKVAKSIADRTYLVPCHLADDTTPDSFTIGPVNFRQSQLAFKQIDPALDAYLNEARSDTTNYLRKTLVSDARKYYTSFNWIAEVKITGCSPDVSSEHATQIVQSAVNCIHLLIGAAHSHRVRVGGPNYQSDVRSKISLDENGKTDLTTTRSWEGHRWENDWWQRLAKQGAVNIISLMGTAIVAGHDLPKGAPLAQRFIDASSWYGEAVRDKFPASRIIKYMTAIERIVTTKNEDCLSETISRRGAALLTAGGLGNFQNNCKRIKDAYDERSRLIHGSTSPNQPLMGVALREAEYLSRQILLCSLLFFGEKGLQTVSVSEKLMDEHYAKIITLSGQSPLSCQP